jgi:transcriptional regulator of acetoin/glycerol metabolism
MAALQIESEYFRNAFRENIILQFHNRAEFAQTLEAGLIALNYDGRIIAANRQARFYLQGLEVVPGNRFECVFRIPFDRFIRQTASPGSGDLVDDRGSRYKVLVSNLTQPNNFNLGTAFEHSTEDKRVPFICEDQKVLESMHLIERAVDWQVPILIRGETGSGKELMAMHAHKVSKRSGKFVAINCAALPETLVESELFGYREGSFTGGRRGGGSGLIRDADRGTLFLDEIGDMPVSLQSRLLRFLDQRTVRAVGSSVEQEVDVQIIAATNSPLESAIEQRRFRSDLFYRLQGVEVTIPPLRERSDFHSIVFAILKSFGGSCRISAGALDLLQRHDWPGNFRELKNALLRMVITAHSTLLEESDVMPFLKLRREPAPQSARHVLQSSKSKTILDTYHRCDGNIVKTAGELGVSRNTVYRELRRQRVI